MKSSIRAALAVGALALASSQASASSISVYEGMSTYSYVQTTRVAPNLDPNFYELNVANADTGMLIRLVDTTPDNGSASSWTVTYDIYKDSQAGSGYSYNSITDLIDSFSINDTGFNLSNPSPWHFTNLALVGEYVLRIQTNGASGSDSQISAVPLPAAAWLFGSALLGLGAMRRKQKAAAKSEMALA
jgi:hypothetical protein